MQRRENPMALVVKARYTLGVEESKYRIQAYAATCCVDDQKYVVYVRL
jgi:hypothetical protein